PREGDVPRGHPGRAPRLHDGVRRPGRAPPSAPDVPGLAARSGDRGFGRPPERRRRHAGHRGAPHIAPRGRVPCSGAAMGAARARRLGAGVRSPRRAPLHAPRHERRASMTARFIYFATESLDGYIEDPQGKFDWARPDEEVHRFVNDLLRPVGAYLYGRRMYETMRGWETEYGRESDPPWARDFAKLW